MYESVCSSMDTEEQTDGAVYSALSVPTHGGVPIVVVSIYH